MNIFPQWINDAIFLNVEIHLYFIYLFILNFIYLLFYIWAYT